MVANPRPTSFPTATPHTSSFVTPTPTYYTLLQISPRTRDDRSLRSQIVNSSCLLHLDSSRSPTPMSYSAIMTSRTICSASPLYFDTAIPPRSEHDFALHTPENVLLYGTKAPHSNTWRFSLARPKDFRAYAVIRHEQHAESVLFAYATFASPSFPHILQRGEARMAT